MLKWAHFFVYFPEWTRMIDNLTSMLRELSIARVCGLTMCFRVGVSNFYFSVTRHLATISYHRSSRLGSYGIPRWMCIAGSAQARLSGNMSYQYVLAWFTLPLTLPPNPAQDKSISGMIRWARQLISLAGTYLHLITNNLDDVRSIVLLHYQTVD